MLELKDVFNRQHSEFRPQSIQEHNHENKISAASLSPMEEGDWWIYTFYRSVNDQLDVFIGPDIYGERAWWNGVPQIRQRQLTSHPADDYSPRLNVDGSKVVFVSERDGQEEIYTIQEDGSNLARITNDGASDFSPVWSPDGTSVAFVSDRSGTLQIYHMDADGSNVEQLSTGPAPHIYPDWSGDGTRLTWVEILIDPIDDTQTRKLQLYYLDTQLLGDLTPPLLQIAHPRWSPDNSLIAFDYDANGDFLNELATVAPATSQVVVYPSPDPGYNIFHDYNVEGWTPSGDNRLMIKQVEYIVIDNQISSATVSTLEADLTTLDEDGKTPMSVYLRFGLGFANEAYGIDLVQGDLDAPSSRVNPLPQFTHLSATTLTSLTWGGTDKGISKIDEYEIEYRTGSSNEWLPLYQGKETQVSLFPSEPFGPLESVKPVGTYYFRSRAIDYAGNQEEFTTNPEGDASTTYYSSLLHGHLSDNRGVPLGTTLFTVSGNEEGVIYNQGTTNSRGDYRLYIAEDMPVEIHTDVRVPVGSAVVRHLYQPASDNLLRNGSFELGATDWLSTNTQMVTDSAQVYMGETSAQLTGSCTGACLENIIQLPIGSSYDESVEYAHFDAAFSPSNEFDFFFADRNQRWTVSEGWSPPIKIIEGEFTQRPTYDKQGNLHIINQNYHQYRLADSTWQEPIELESSDEHRIILGDDGELHMLMAVECSITDEGCKLGYRTFSVIDGWSMVEVLPNSNVSNSREKFDFFVSADGVVHVIWDESPLAAVATNLINYQFRSANSQWSEIVQISHSTKITDELSALTINGELRVLPLSDAGTQPFTLYSSDQWRTNKYLSDKLTQTYLDNESGLYSIDNFGRTIVNDIDTTHYEYRYGTIPSGWSDTQKIFMGAEMLSPDPAFASYGNFVSQNGTLYSVIASQHHRFTFWHQPQAESASTSAVAQTVTIPTDMQNPTLSFMHRINGMNTNANSHLDVMVTNGITATTMVSLSTNTPWQLGWVDLSARAGETVTVTFALNQSANETIATVMLDAISIGSWTTPAIESISEHEFPAGEAATLIITGTNFLDVTSVHLGTQLIDDVEIISNNQIKITLDKTLNSGRFPVIAANSSGQRYISQEKVQIGEQLFLPVVTR